MALEQLIKFDTPIYGTMLGLELRQRKDLHPHIILSLYLLMPEKLQQIELRSKEQNA